MSQIYRYELTIAGMDFRNGLGFNICWIGIYRWFHVPLSCRQVDLLVSTEEFEGSISARPKKDSIGVWWLMRLDGIEEGVTFYERTSNILKEVSNKKIYIGVEY